MSDTWYRDAILYELRVRSFFDGNGDGIGDFAGLTGKLDYLQDLGVTAVWLLPFYPSPLRDDGYDISDYMDVHPECGTLADFDRFLAEAHRRGLKVITELVLNHTSDQHPWFQGARRAAPGSPERELYVWSDSPERYREARIIFKDFEPSNWSWDPRARAYFWHRFYAHQPDLNFDNPAVREAMLSVVDFWFDRGVDGLRLDAVPYLFEREGTCCENLPETHAFLRKLRAHVDARFKDRMLLAEANQWPEDAVAYFGHGDECHMAFHFPIMPRIFMSIHAEDRFPIVDILAQTPELPDKCQWALFLRNHDELTLEMVTDEERDAMVRAYAAEPEMRINLGIRRRLAPLAGNDRRNIELMNALLFSLPGTPVVYYGDEIGMGDNVYLGDRDGVRTPMQWSGDRNAGYSRANPQRLVLPVSIDPEYHFEAINVEAQQQNPNSLLWWTKRLIALRKRSRAFGRGALELLTPDNPRILAFLRRHEGERVLVVANLSRRVEFVELDLAAYQGLVPVELFGRSELPAIGAGRYPLTLAGHGFYLLSLEPPAASTVAEKWRPPTLPSPARWATVLDPQREAALADLAACFTATHGHFTGRGRRMDRARLVDILPVGDPPVAHILVVEIAYSTAERERYTLPIALAEGPRASEIQARAPGSVVANLAASEAPGVLFDAGADPATARAILETLLLERRVEGRSGAIVAQTLGWAPPSGSTPPPRAFSPPADERSGDPGRVMVAFGERFSLTSTRRVEDGPSHGLEMSRFLAAHASSTLVPTLRASVEYVSRGRAPATLAVLRAYPSGETDGRTHAQNELARFFERALTRAADAPQPSPRAFRPLAFVEEEPSTMAREVMGPYLDVAARIGRQTAGLHLALASAPDEPGFAPEPYSPLDQRGTYQAMRSLAGKTLRRLRAEHRKASLEDGERLLGTDGRLLQRLGALLGRRLLAQRTRCHGHFGLSYLIFHGNDLIITGLDGDPARPASEHRRKSSPLRDVAAMVRSFHGATHRALSGGAGLRPEDLERARPWADLWWWSSSTAFVGTYLGEAEEGSFLPKDREELRVLLDAFMLESGLLALSAALEARRGVAEATAFLLRLLEAA